MSILANYKDLTNKKVRGTVKEAKEEKKLAVTAGKELRDKILADVDGKMTVDEIVNNPLIQEAEKKIHFPF